MLELGGATLVWKGVADYDWRISLILTGLAIIGVVEYRARH